MESLLPSEIARLVYGYLIEENCEAAAQLFLETCSCLKECVVLKKKGRRFNTSVLGLSLVDILNLYTDAVCLVKNYLERKDSLNEPLSDFVKELGNILVLDHESGNNIAKTVFLRISVPKKRNIRKRSERVENNEEEEEEEEEEEREKEGQIDQKKSSQNEETNINKNNPTATTDDFDLNMLQTLLDNTALHERLAENINKAIDSSGEISNHKTDEKKIIETILHNTEADPIFHELLDELVGPRAEDTTTPEDTDKENGDPAEDRLTSNSETGQTNEDPETMKKFEEESNLAVAGILAGNKMRQQETVPEDQPTVVNPDAVIISTQPAIETSNGVYKQSFIIPAGYTVTDVIPATQVQALSTPLQPLKITNIATFGHLSPILPQPSGASMPITRVRNTFQPGRRILPKSAAEGFVIQIPTQNDIFQEVKVDIPTVPKRLPEVIKRSRVRTRGGIQKVGTRGVKAIAPLVSRSADGKIDVVYGPRSSGKVSTSSIKTRAMLKNQQKEKKDLTTSCEIEIVQHQLFKEPQEIVDNIKETDSVPIEKQNEDCNKEENEGTPEQQLTVSKPRKSFSTPRRNHVRVLDFATPVKELAFRKSLTSPKVYHHKRKESSSLEMIKRGMFNSPPKETAIEKEKTYECGSEKNIKDWDADLRKFSVTGEGMDIPTSVGLKRKNNKKKVPRKRSEKKLHDDKKSNEELVDQIEKEVRDVIGEEEMVLNTSQSSEIGNLIEQKLIEEVNKNDSMNSSEKCGKEKTQCEASDLPNALDENITPKEVTEVPSKIVEELTLEPQENEQQDSMNDVNEKEEHSNMQERFNTSTPLKLAMSPVNENSRGQLTPTTKLVMSHLGKVSTRFPSVFSPTSQTTLENLLIKECSRMESEKTMDHLTKENKKLDSPKSNSGNCNENSLLEGKVPDLKNINSNQSNAGSKGLTFESVCKNNLGIFQTPAKFLSATIPPGTPVEMTPLTRLLASETSFSATVLVTPTLPTTPKNLSLSETPPKTDGNSSNVINISGNESSKLSEKVSNLSNKQLEEITKKGNINEYQLESNREAKESQSILIDDNKSTNKNNIEKIEDDTPTKTIDKNICKTPKIKLLSPKLSKVNINEPLCKKKKGKLIEQYGSKEENLSKQMEEMTAKANSRHNSCYEIVGEKVLDTNSHTEPGETKKTPERMYKKKTNTKQVQSETKEQILRKSKRSFRSDGNKKSLRQNSSKPLTKLMVDEEMEMEICHLLKDAKAKLFGPDNSSDSDSVSDPLMKSSLSKKGSNVQIKTARERLQKLENIRMLDSSSTSDESSENEKETVKHRDIEKDSHLKDEIFVEKKAVEPEHSNVEGNMENNKMKNDEDIRIKKGDGSSSSKLLEVVYSKTVSKEVEESCESFPTLHLSEESNQSSKFDNQVIKCSKLRKSPLSGNDLLGKKTNSLLLSAFPLKPGEQVEGTAVNKGTESDQIKTINSSTDQTVSEPGISEKPSTYQELHLNEQVFHINERNGQLKSRLSDSVEKLNQDRHNAVSKYLDNYVYSFALNVDKSGNHVNKELRTSAFLNIFDLGKSLPVFEHNNSEPSSTDDRSHIRSKTKNRKRHRSESSSEDEKEKRDRVRTYSSYRGDRGREYRGSRVKGSYDRRDSLSRMKYSSRNYNSRYHDYDHFSPYVKKRLRHESPDSRRTCKRENKRTFEKKIQSSKYEKKSLTHDKRYNDSFASPKSGREAEGKRADPNSPHSSDRTIEAQKNRCSSSSRKLSIPVEDQPISKQNSVSHKRTSKVPDNTEKEEGEISDSSEIKKVSHEVNRSMVLSLGAHDSRATLLRKVDLDHFLSIVHGKEE